MGPACVLLDRSVPFRDHPQEPYPLRGGEGADGVVGGTTVAPSEHLSPEAIEAAVAQYLRAMTPDLQVVDPPGVSRLTIVRPLSTDPIPKYGRYLTSGIVAAADKNLILLYAGSYVPASSYEGWYLLFDAASSSLSTIPGIHYMSDFTRAGYGTVIMAREGGAFVLSELLVGLHGEGRELGMLCLWQSSRSSEQESKWDFKVGDLPEQVCWDWRIHVSFSVQSRNLFCWVDLLHGLLLCDLGRHCEVDSSGLDLSFVPLPDGCPTGGEHYRWLNPQDFRTMACVDGTIKFLTMDGFEEEGQVSLVTYTLDLDGSSPSWTENTVVLHLMDLWADETFISMGLPRIKPMFPILSTQEDDVVYLVMPGDLDDVEGFMFRRVHTMLSVNMRKSKIISTNHENCPKTLFSSQYLLAFNASLTKYHKRAVEAIEMGASVKKTKF